MMMSSISELLVPTQAMAQTQEIAQTIDTDDLYYYNVFGKKISLTVLKDAIAVKFKSETGGYGLDYNKLYLKLQQDLQIKDQSIMLDNNSDGVPVQVSALRKNYALVILPSGTSTSSVEVQQLIEELDYEELDYVEAIFPVYMQLDATSDSLEEVLMPLNTIIIRFDSSLPNSKRQAILSDNNLEIIRAVGGFSFLRAEAPRRI